MIIATAFFSQTTVEFALLGLATGALYAVFALGIVLTYRASGVLNFATGGLGAIAAFLFYSLRDNHGFPWIVALALALLLGAVIGALMQVFLMVVLRKVSLLGKLISTLALISLSEGLIAVIWPSNQGVQTPNSILPTHTVYFTSQIVIPEDRLIIMGIMVVLTVVLRFVYSRTMFGLATSAVAESHRVAASSGWSPRRIELINFIVTGVLSAGAAILLAPIVGLDAGVLTLVVLPALAAALVGRFSSFAITVAAALGIGVATTELQLFQFGIAGALGWSQQALNGLPDVAPLLVIIAATMITGRARLQRGELLTRLPLPGDGKVPRLLLVAGVGIAVLLLFTLSPNWDAALATTFAWGIVILSVVVVTGYCGQLSLCQYALAGFGAWVASRLASTQGVPFEFALLAGMVACIPLGLLVALPALRTRGVNLAVATLALALMIEELIFDNGPLTGGFIGTVVGPPHFLGINLDPIRHSGRYGAFVLVAFLLAGLAVANVRRGRAGRRLLAVRANERAAASLGVGVYGAKLYAFGLSSAIAGLAGVLIGFQNSYVQFTNFDVFGSINAVLYSILGGLGWAAGSVIGALQAPGAAASTLFNQAFNQSGDITNYLLIFAGVSTFLILWQAPDGLAAYQSRQWRALTARFRRERRLVARAPEPQRARAPATLEISNLTVRFGGVVALDDISFSVPPGAIVGLIGPNGAGKTTLLDVVTGFTRQELGTVALDGESVDKWSPEKRAREGMGRSWQAVELFEEMTLRENLLVAADRKAFARYLIDIVRPGRPLATVAMNEVVHEFELADHLEERPSSLSQGTARLAGIARAIVTEPKVLLLDEPAAGLDSHESEELGLAIQAVVERTGIGVLIVEHDVNLLLNICDRIVVLDFGKKIAEGTPAEISSAPAVIAAYLGVSDEEAAQPTLAPPRGAL